MSISNGLLEWIISVERTRKTCRHCSHRERHQCGTKVIQYCGILGSNRTLNGKLKIKVTKTACHHYGDVK